LEIDDDSFWREFRRRVKAVNPEAYIVAEVWHEAPRYLQGDQFDAYMNYPLAASIISFTGASNLDRRVLQQHFNLDATIYPIDGPEFARRLERGLGIYDPAVVAVQLNLIDTHDTPRFLSMTSGDVASLRLATILQMTLPGAPSIYYGDEIGMRGEQDPGCRGAFPWDDRASWDLNLLAFTTGAVAARHANPVLRRGSYRTAAAWGAAMAFVRGPVAGAPGPAVVVAINAGDVAVPLDLDVPELTGQRLVAVHWAGMPDAPAGGVAVRDGRATLMVPPRAGLLLRAEAG
jgi:neopullulanase